MSGSGVQVERRGAVAALRLPGPIAHAALGLQTAAELHARLDELEDDDALRALVVVFAGAEASPIRPAQDDIVATASAIERLGRFTRPAVAAIEGSAYGVALELALACDLRVGRRDASFGLPGIGFGAMPYAGATQRLPRLVGMARALDLVLTGEAVGAGEAQRIGLVQRLADGAEALPAALAVAEAIARAAPASMRLTKEALHQGIDMTLAQGLRMELDLYLLLFSTEDRVEGIQAFRDKRPPRFTGS